MTEQSRSSSSRSTIGKIASIVLALAGMLLCLCSALYAAITLFRLRGPTGETLTTEEGIFAVGLCGVPALVLLVVAVAIWFWIGRTKSNGGR